MNCIAKTLLPLLLLVAGAAKAQTISGKMYDESESKPVPFAVIAILKPVDSILVKFTRSDKDGNFNLKDVSPGKYVLMITHPKYADVVYDITAADDGLTLNTVNFIPKTKLLQEVFVRNGGAIKIKGDTVSYMADSFKVGANANVEELLKKLPGIQVDKDGKIKAMGETVEKVLVDGEEFFGDDPGMAVKNLRADAVKEVQVFDKKSEQSEFTGIDDGTKQKTINLKLKDDKKKGYFGKVDAAGGPLKKIDNRYNTNVMFNAFKGKRKISVFSLNGNTGQDGLSWQDSEKYGSERDDVSMSMDEEGGMMTMWRGGSSDDEPWVNTQNGFITNNNAGLHYSNKWDDKITLSLSPKYNRQLYNNLQTNFTQRQIGDSVLNDYSTTSLDVNRYNFKNSLSFDIKFDSSNSLKITARANFYHTESTEEIISETISNTDKLKNSRNQVRNQTNDKTAINTSAIFRHKFKKARRTLSINTDWNRLSTEGNTLLKSNSQIFDNIPSVIIQDQLSDNNKVTNKLTTRAVYTEPLSKKMALELGYEFSFSRGTNNSVVNQYSPVSGKYDELLDTLSNNFKQTISINKPNIKISYNFKKIKFNFGSGFGITNFDFTDVSFNQEYKRNFTNLFPAASFNYTYKANHSINFSYNGNTSQPSLNQLQPLRNNNDFFNQYIGNPNLKQSFTHSFNLSHQSYDFLKDLWMYQSFNVRSTANSITNSITTDLQSGKTVSQPINTNGNLSMNFWSGLGMKVKKLNLNVNFQPSFSFNRFADVINGNTSFSNTLNAGFGIWLSKSKEKKYDFSVNNDITYNRNKTSQNSNINKFLMNTLNVNATVYYKKVWSLVSDYNFFARQKTIQFQDNLTNHILNAKLQRTFKDNEFTAYVLVRDILNQNIGIERNFYGNVTSEVTNQRLQRYFMVGFTWDFKNSGAKPAAQTP
ncbi:MAG TPA: outer membrane beta-barrel family protein [Ferruginibacter sp.]|nr:outer membrane beta-barrel family protein [Ferruginibacter sp.]